MNYDIGDIIKLSEDMVFVVINVDKSRHTMITKSFPSIDAAKEWVAEYEKTTVGEGKDL